MIRDLLDWIQGNKLLRRAASIYDLKFKDLLLGEYKQKLTSKRLWPLFPENQYSLNVCSFEAGANALSVYFGEQVSVKWLTAKAYQQGYCKKNGAATVEMFAKVARKFGVVFEKDLPSYENEGWDNFIKVDFTKFDPIASQNKIGSYYWCDTYLEVLQAIDQGYAVSFGRDFYTPNPFVSPWIIGRNGTRVGPHATLVSGYKEVLFDILNSWGLDWGDKGHAYIPQGDIQKDIEVYGAVAITPIPYTPKDIKIKNLLTLIQELKDKLKNMINASNILYGTAVNLRGHNIAPELQPLGCARSVAYIVNKAFQENNKWASTDDLYHALKDNPKWEQIDVPEKGAVIVSVTGMIPSNSGIRIWKDGKRHGHCGIIGKNLAPDQSLWIMSNSSDEHQWMTNYTYQKWSDYFIKNGKAPTFMFRRLCV